jgi:CBS-domain-containing membrane protein
MTWVKCRDRQRAKSVDSDQGWEEWKPSGSPNTLGRRPTMKALDIMTKDVVSVRPETPVRDIAALMTEKRISGLPVLGADGTLLGIVSQSDLLHRWEIGMEPNYKWWLKVFLDSDSLARAFSKPTALKPRTS